MSTRRDLERKKNPNAKTAEEKQAQHAKQVIDMQSSHMHALRVESIVRNELNAERAKCQKLREEMAARDVEIHTYLDA